jgi:hypothetical protein
MMTHTIGGPPPLPLLPLVLIVGRFVTSRVAFLARYSIPHAVTGGIDRRHPDAGASPRAASSSPSSGRSSRTSCSRSSRRSGSARTCASSRAAARRLLVFLACVAAVLVLQNVVGIAVATATAEPVARPRRGLGGDVRRPRDRGGVGARASRATSA